MLARGMARLLGALAIIAVVIGGYRAFALLEMPIGEANAAIMERIRAQQNLYTRFRALQAFQELEKDVEAYEKWKREQTP